MAAAEAGGQTQTPLGRSRCQMDTRKRRQKSIRDDIGRLRRLGALRGKELAAIDRRLIMRTVEALSCGNSTKNRYLALIRAILNKAEREWE